MVQRLWIYLLWLLRYDLFNIKLWFMVIRYLMISSWRHNLCFIYVLSSKYVPSFKFMWSLQVCVLCWQSLGEEDKTRSKWGGGDVPPSRGLCPRVHPQFEKIGPHLRLQDTSIDMSPLEKVVHPLVPPWKLDPSYATDPEVAGSNPALVNFYLFIQNVSRNVLSVSLVVYYMMHPLTITASSQVVL